MAAIVILISAPSSFLLGVLAAIYQGRSIDRIITTTILGRITVPDFFVAIVLILVFAVQLELVPAVSYLTGTESIFFSLYALALPIAKLVLVISAQMIRMIRAAILNVMHAPFIETAILKSLPLHTIVLRYALLNAFGPVINVIALNLAYGNCPIP